MAKPRLCFTVVSELLRGQQFILDGDQPIMMGRTPDNTLALDHKSVSRRHARVEANGADFVLVDLGSHNGTRVGDKLISKEVLHSGDVIGLGEVQLRFTTLNEANGAVASAAAAASNLPAVVPAQANAGAALPARPLSFEEVFAQAGPTQTVPKAKPRRNYWPFIYTLLLIVVLVLGLGAFWAVGQRPGGPPKLDVQVRAGETLPVNLAVLPGPGHQGAVIGLGRIEEIGQPSDQRVADAHRTPFRSFVIVKGKSLGTTDIPIYGPPAGLIVLRVLVRDVKPSPEGTAAMTQPLPERRAYAYKLLERARSIVRSRGLVNDQTWQTIQELDLAERLLRAIPGETTPASEASQLAREMRTALTRRFEQLTRDIDILLEQGKLRECMAKTLELRKLYPDPETEEHHIIKGFYEFLTDQMERQEREAQEKR